MKAKSKRVHRNGNSDVAEIIRAFSGLARSMNGYSAGKMTIFLSSVPLTVGVIWVILSPNNISYVLIAFSLVMAAIGAYLESRSAKMIVKNKNET
jgi:hypothetical protein